MRDDYAEEIRYRLDIQTVAEHYGLEFNRARFARCPFHNERTASFKIQNSRFAHCFGCGENADVIKLAGQLLGLGFRDTMRTLNKDFSLNLPLDGKPNLRAQREAKRRREARKAEEAARLEARSQEARLWDLWILYDQWRTEYAPKSPDEPLDPRYVMAIQEIDSIAQQIDTQGKEHGHLGELRKATG